MGWDYTHATHYKNGKVDRKAECDERYTWSTETKTVRVLKSSMVNTVYYAAIETIENGKREVWAGVALTAGKDRFDPYFNFGIKQMDEGVQPGCYDCPKGILDLLTPTDNESANVWRKLCREKKATKKTTSWLKKLPCGSRVIWTDQKGEKHILVKREPAYQFKTWFWFDASNGYYIQKKYVTEENTAKLEEV